jgi:hypothetical protein
MYYHDYLLIWLLHANQSGAIGKIPIFYPVFFFNIVYIG